MNIIPGLIKDGDYDVIYSNSFNLFGDRLQITISGFRFTFIFAAGFEAGTRPTTAWTYADNNTSILVTLNNFRNPLGAATIQPVFILGNVALAGLPAQQRKRLYFSVKANALDQTGTPLEVTVTFSVQDMPPPPPVVPSPQESAVSSSNPPPATTPPTVG